jgi:hypothetical protein
MNAFWVALEKLDCPNIKTIDRKLRAIYIGNTIFYSIKDMKGNMEIYAVSGTLHL